MTSHRNPAGRFAEAARGAAGRAAGAMSDRARRSLRPRSGAKKTVLGTIQQVPMYLRLLGGLLVDRRVAVLDKLLVAAALAYMVAPIDLIPDFIPFFGEVDDVFLLMTALQRLVTNAGRRVLLDHWSGPRSELSDLNLERVVNAAAFFLPLGMRRKLRGVARRGSTEGVLP